jgi:hypothetical protein
MISGCGIGGLYEVAHGLVASGEGAAHCVVVKPSAEAALEAPVRCYRATEGQRTDERQAIEYTARVDGFAIVRFLAFSDRIEILKANADGIECCVAL